MQRHDVMDLIKIIYVLLLALEAVDILLYQMNIKMIDKFRIANYALKDMLEHACWNTPLKSF